jgi:hypothetical protein
MSPSNRALETILSVSLQAASLSKISNDQANIPGQCPKLSLFMICGCGLGPLAMIQMSYRIHLGVFFF